MQDIPTLGGVGGGSGGGRIFNISGVSGVDRRLQQHSHQNQQPLKCPRCDSQNTKFCYYNNYNLSQPRHYCKNCRRYWTKGGILRNVPVGGGCRKSKRSSKSKSSGDTSASNTYAATDTEKTELITSNSHSSSESSSLTTTTVSISAMPAMLDSYPPPIEQHQESLNGHMLPMTNMMSSCNEPGLVGSNQESQNDQEKIIGCSITEMASMEFLDQHQDVDLMALEPPNKEKNTGLATLDWGNVGTGGAIDAGGIDKHGGDVGGGRGGAEHGLFDFSGVDETYWNQVQWVDDNEQSFNFMPQFQVLDFNLENK